MKLDTQRGLYRSSFFYIDINSFEKFDRLIDLVDQLEVEKDPQEKEKFLLVLSAFIHEYFHFIQDVSTYFGLSTAWNVYNQLLTITSYIQKETESITIPINKNNLIEVRKHYSFLKNTFADVNARFVKRYNKGDLQIGDVKVYTPLAFSSDLLKEDYFVQLELLAPDGERSNYEFGAVAVLETMVNLFQSRFFDTDYHLDFPYRSGVLLANKVLYNNLIDHEAIFVLCDLSLMSPYPGYTFYQLLNMISAKELTFKETEDLIVKGMQYLENKWNIKEMFLKSKQGVTSVMKSLLNHEHFWKTYKWFEIMMEEGYQYRQSNPFFMLQIYKSNVPFGEELTKFFLKVGCPELRNLDRLRWYKSPEKMVDDEDVFPGYMQALDSLLSLFIVGDKACSLHEYCKKSATPMPVDEDCLKKPWIKAELPKLCPFATFWNLYNLDAIKNQLSN